MKNYYKILELTPSATQQEVKKAYRRLALAHHPDTNPDNETAGSRFREIQEAYQVLSHPDRRSDYNQRRWYRRNSARNDPDETLSPLMIYRKTNRLRQFIHTVQSSFLNLQALYRYVYNLLLGEPYMAVLRAAGDSHTNRQITEALLEAGNALPYDKLKNICERLLVLAAGDAETEALIQTRMRQRKLSAYWEKYQSVFVILITLVICWLIYIISS